MLKHVHKSFIGSRGFEVELKNLEPSVQETFAFDPEVPDHEALREACSLGLTHIFPNTHLGEVTEFISITRPRVTGTPTRNMQTRLVT